MKACQIVNTVEHRFEAHGDTDTVRGETDTVRGDTDTVRGDTDTVRVYVTSR